MCVPTSARLSGGFVRWSGLSSRLPSVSLGAMVTCAVLVRAGIARSSAISLFLGHSLGVPKLAYNCDPTIS